MNWFIYGLGGLAAAGAAYLWGMWEAAQLTVRAETLRFPDLPAAFDGFRIVQVSDPHLPRAPRPGEGARWRGERIAEMCRQARPDVIALTGDLVRGRRSQSGGWALLERLAPIAPTFVIPGNEDYQVCEKDLRLDFADTLARWRETGAAVLMNAARPITRDGDTLWLAGTDDSHEHKDDLDAAFANIPADGFIVLLSHSPEIITDPRSGRARLILCGHTHGGQICLPGGYPVFTHSAAGRAYAKGLLRVRGSWLSVSRGIGAVTIPIRLFCTPEVVVLELRRG